MPTHTYAGIVGASALGVSSASLFMGAQVDALVIGLVGAVFVSIWLEAIDNKPKAFAAVICSAMLAGYGSPVAAGWVANAFPTVAGDPEALRMLLALVIAMAAPSLVPLSIRLAAKKVQS